MIYVKKSELIKLIPPVKYAVFSILYEDIKTKSPTFL